MSNFFAGLMWGVILTVVAISIAVSYAPSRHVERSCDVTLTDRVGVEVVIVGQPCEAKV